MKKNTFYTLLFSLTALYAFQNAPVREGDKLIGKWYCEEMDRSTFKVSKKKNGDFSAIVIQSDNPKTIGKEVMKKITYDPEKKKWVGVIKSPSRDMEIDAEFKMVTDSKIQLKGKVFFMTKIFYWERV